MPWSQDIEKSGRNWDASLLPAGQFTMCQRVLCGLLGENRHSNPCSAVGPAGYITDQPDVKCSLKWHWQVTNWGTKCLLIGSEAHSTEGSWNLVLCTLPKSTSKEVMDPHGEAAVNMLLTRICPERSKWLLYTCRLMLSSALTRVVLFAVAHSNCRE